MRKFTIFQLVRSLVRSGRCQYFERYSKLSTMTRDAKVSSCFFCVCGEFIVFDCSSARKLGLTLSLRILGLLNFTNLTVNKLDKSDKSSNMLQVGQTKHCNQ